MSLREQLSKLFFGEKVLVADSGPGLFRSDSEVKHFSPDNIDEYFYIYKNYGIIRAKVDDLAEQAVGLGYYTTVELKDTDTENEKKLKKRAKDLVDQFGRVQNIDTMLPNICRIALIAGFAPVESKIVSQPEKCSLMIIHPETVDKSQGKGVEWSKGEVTKLYQKVGTKDNSVDGKYLAWFNYAPIGNNPLGNSIIAGALDAFNAYISSMEDIKRMLKRYVSPMGIWKTRHGIEQIKAAVTHKIPGEDLFLGNLNLDDANNPDFPKIVQLDPRVPFWEWIIYLDRQLFSYFRSSDMWYYKDATVASAQELEDIVQRHVNSIQRGIKRGMEKYWFTPLLTANKIPLEYLPKVNFGFEATGVENLDPSEIIMKGLDYGIIKPPQYFHILGQMGIKLLQSTIEEEPEASEEEEPVEEPDEDAV